MSLAQTRGGSHALMLAKMDALVIILTAPLWPRREDLSFLELRLHDSMVEWAKVYCINLVRGNFQIAFHILSMWSTELNKMMELTPPDSQQRAMLAAIFVHYADATKVNWLKIQA